MTKLVKNGLTFWPQGDWAEGTLYPELIDFTNWVDCRGGLCAGLSEVKSITDGSEGWAAHLVGDVILIKEWTDVAGDRRSPWVLTKPPVAAAEHLYYPGSTMASAARKATRAGQTEKISISVAATDLVVLRRRAKRLYGGNLSAAVAEGARHIHEQEGREALVAWLGKAGEASPAERDAIRAEWAPEGERPARGQRKTR